ncbi:hypothetical protein [Streptomyces sp. NPDC126499]|uniref:hypothetical protein n=1 Tax=Streptomyces sp. NPDC126499 TaxID=3155314 RepID=UPI00332A9A53
MTTSKRIAATGLAAVCLAMATAGLAHAGGADLADGGPYTSYSEPYATEGGPYVSHGDHATVQGGPYVSHGDEATVQGGPYVSHGDTYVVQGPYIGD